MKECPHCGSKFGLGSFALLYGSDTLVQHSPKARPREHFCLRCHHKFWVHTNYFQFMRQVRVNIGVAAGLAVMMTALLWNTVLPLGPSQTMLFGMLLLFLEIPPAILLAKYQSAKLGAR